MRSLVLALVAFCVASPFAAPSLAQDGSEGAISRTPENARKFLSQLPELYTIEVSSSGSKNSAIGYFLSRYRHDNECSTTIEGKPRWYVLRDQADHMLSGHLGDKTDPLLFVPHHALISAREIVQAPYRVEWGSLDPIHQAPLIGNERLDKRSLRLSTKDWRVNMTFPSEELAGRAMLAMETLRTACDSVADTGF